ncbi:carbamoyltransferase HypF [candidate division KSB1 bacterium]|nr:carbamoyltransferase HypF [candidate division KSB1 bacterium]
MERGERVKIIVQGAVQGVGFRPFVFRLAHALGLHGWVLNGAQGVFIEAEGERRALESFLLRLEKEKPPQAVMQSLEFSFLDPLGYKTFEIRSSAASGPKTALILPDIATCAACVREIFDPRNRRYLYPFTNCTNCGPRFTIITALPYDRPNTAMQKFAMCAACQCEYDDANDRRFHAQPNACPACGPQLELWDAEGNTLALQHGALLQAAQFIRAGGILAFKGLGGYQLLVDARNPTAIARLRERKRREEKPFALMYPSLQAVASDCRVSVLEERLLLSPQSPIVLLERLSAHSSLSIAALVAPENPYLGVMLPYSPLHHLLMHALQFPVVATSGNLSDEPICINENEALARLRGIAEAFLVHDRPIVRHVDDSIVRVLLGRELVLRRGRGYAPLPICLSEPVPSILAVGAHLKNTIALSVGSQVFLSQHIGDLETQEAYSAFQKVIADFQRLYEVAPAHIACDLHPEYLSTKYARALATPVLPVQHHYAHVVACMAENELSPPVLGVSWDGTGYGPDGTIWGGEFLLVNGEGYRRAAYFLPFKIPGGEAAIKQPRRAALGALHETFGENIFAQHDLEVLQHFAAHELAVLRRMLAKDINAPRTSSVGRLFDAVAALLGLRQQTNYEGQAAMALEFACGEVRTEAHYSFQIRKADERQEKFQSASSPALSSGDCLMIDWRPMLVEIVNDIREALANAIIAVKFHNTLAEVIVACAHKLGEQKIVLTGGCFQNKMLVERAVHRLEQEGFRPYWHQRVPPNDGGIALGQVVAAAQASRNKSFEPR